MIKVADTAKNQVSKLMILDGFNPKDDYIRVGVKSGGCSGLSYELNFDKNKEDNDKVFEHIGTTLEYSGGLNGKGFVFKNPNASRTCGCGESFSL
jgi:iron-sulfur cluster assembly protein